MRTAAFILFSALVASAQPFYKATWDVVPNTNVAGYRVLMGTVSGRYTATNSVEGRLNNTVTLSNAPAGVVHLVALSYLVDGTESLWSIPEVKWTNRAFAPKNFKLSAEIQAGRSTAGPWTNLVQLNVPMPPANDGQQFFRTRLLLEELP